MEINVFMRNIESTKNSFMRIVSKKIDDIRLMQETKLLSFDNEDEFSKYASDVISIGLNKKIAAAIKNSNINSKYFIGTKIITKFEDIMHENDFYISEKFNVDLEFKFESRTDIVNSPNYSEIIEKSFSLNV